MPDWLAIVVGVLLLGLVWSDRGGIRAAWDQPARWWSRDTAEALRAREPAQPLNVAVGVVLGAAAIVYGVIAIVT